jgi:amino acid transporter
VKAIADTAGTGDEAGPPRAVAVTAGAPGRRQLGLFSVIALGVNTIVGSGIFRLPAELAGLLGPASIAAFAACALLLVAVALSFAEVGGMFSEQGGAYLYAREAFGPGAGFVVGWTAWVATVFTLATVSVAVPDQLAELAPALGSRWGVVGGAVGLVVALGAVNLLGVRPAALVSNLLVVAKVLPLVLFVAVGLAHVRPDNLAPVAPHGCGALPAAMLLAFFALSGFETSAIPAGDAARPRRHVPIAVVASVLGAAALYMLIQLVVVGVLPGAGASTRPLADATRVFAGPGAAAAVAVLGAVSMIGLCAAMALAGPRLLAALSRDRFLPARLGAEGARGVPALATIATTAAAALAAALLDFRRLVDFTSIVVIVQYLAACAAVPVLRIRRPDLARTVRLPGGPTIPLVGAALLIWVLAQVSAIELAMAAAATAAGVVAAVATRAARRRTP